MTQLYNITNVGTGLSEIESQFCTILTTLLAVSSAVLVTSVLYAYPFISHRGPWTPCSAPEVNVKEQLYINTFPLS